MRKYSAIILALMTIFLLCVPAFAAEYTPNETFTISVNNQLLELDDLPFIPYRDSGTIMVPLRKIGEALGYKVDWNPETQAITIDDGYIQIATLFHGTASAVFEGKLQIINMSREIENAVPTVIRNGCTYVPLEFFQEFFNDTNIEGTTIMISPSKSELCGTLEQQNY